MSELLGYLERNRTKTGLMATLRCGLNPSREVRAWPVLARFSSLQGHEYDVIRSIAGLFASHPETRENGNMGDLCRELCAEDESKTLAPGNDSDPQDGPMSKRLQYLLAADRSEICDRVVRMVLFAKAKGRAVNYVMLEKDLREWPRARARWAQSFWGGAPRKDADTAETGKETADTEDKA